MLNTLNKLRSYTVWDSKNIPLDEWKFRALRRIILPINDLLLILAGVLGARYGIPAIEEFFPSFLTDAASYVLALLGLLCLIGVVIPRLWPLEAAAKTGVIGLLYGYVGALSLLTASGDDTRGFVVAIACMATLLPIFRLSVLGNIRRVSVKEHQH